MRQTYDTDINTSSVSTGASAYADSVRPKDLECFLIDI